MKITLTTKQAKLLKNLIEKETLQLMAEDDKGYTDPQGRVSHTRHIDICEKYDRIWEKLDKALEEANAE